MNQSFKYAISVAIGAAMVTPAFAQRDNFPDVNDTHWAYEAVARLKKEGIITGYPDGTFKGARAITRYELATLLYALYMNLKNVTEGLDARISSLDERVNKLEKGGGGTAPGNDGALRDAIDSLRKEMASMKSWGDDIATLKKMSASYEKELSSMGVDVEAMKKDLNDLKTRVAKLEGGAGKSGISISGDVNFFMGANSKGTKGGAAINSDGRFFGASGVGAGFDTLTVLHELGLKLKTNNESGTNAVAEIVMGNMVGGGSGFVDQSTTNGLIGTAYNAGASTTQTYLHRLYATLSDGLGGLDFDAKIGRQGLWLGKWVAQRDDNTSFFSNERYDNGAFTMDGASFKFGLGENTDLGIFLGNVSNANGTGNAIQPIATGALPIARAMGGHLGFKVGDKGGLNLTFVDFDSNAVVGGANRTEVYGADFNYALSDSIKLSAGTGKAQPKIGNTNVATAAKKTRTNVGVDFKSGGLGVSAAYAEIGAAYNAPGSWSKDGIFWNLGDLKRMSIDASFDVNESLKLRGGFTKGDQFSTGTKDVVKSTKIGADFKITGAWSLMADYEDTKFTAGFVTPAASQFKFTTIGLGYDMGASTLLKLFYQYGDHTGLTGSGVPIALLNGAGANNGATFGAQFSVKF
jgi:S-layer homology domain